MHRIFVAISLFAALQTPAMTVAFKSTAVEVSGVTPGATVVLHGTARLRIDYNTVVRRFTRAVSDDDRDGTVTYDIGLPMPPHSVWLVADSASGEVSVASPAAQLAAPHDETLNLRQRGEEPADRFSCACLSLDMLYVVPGGGVWLIHAADGTPSDHDPREAVTTASLADALPLLPSAGERPKEFAAGSTVVALDVDQREVFTRRVTADDRGGVQ